MPLLGTKGAASAQGFGLFLSSGPAQWMGQITESTFNSYSGIEGIAPVVTASGSIYVFIPYPYADPETGSIYNRCAIYLYNNNGLIVNSKYYLFPSEYALSTSTILGAILNSDETITIVGRYTQSVENGYSIKIASDLTSSDARIFVGATGNYWQFFSIFKVNSTTNVVGGKFANSVPFLRFFNIANNTSTAQLELGNPDGTSSMTDVFCAADSTTAKYGAFSSETNPAKLKIAKFTATGDISWKKRYVLGTQNLRPTGIDLALGVSDNLVIACNNSGSTVVIQLNTDGTIAWAKNIVITGNMLPTGITTDGSFVYVTGYLPNTKGYIVRLSFTDGSLSYMNSFVNSFAVLPRPKGLKIVGDYMYISGSGPTICKLPKDGTQTGTFTSSTGATITYASEGSASVTNATITVTNWTGTASASSTNSAITLSENSTGFQSNLYLK
jgi:hypothetical protein